jgi:glutamine cyclotransferase
MEKISLFKKSLVLVLIILFVGASFTLNIFIRNVRADPGDVVNSFDSPGSNPLGLAWDGTYLWNVDNHDIKIYKLDPSDGSVIDSFNSPDSAPWGLAWDGNYLWNSNHEIGPGMIYKLDPSDGSVIDSFSAPGSDPCDLTWDGNYLWNTDHGTVIIYKLDPSDGSVIDSFSAPGFQPYGLTWDGNYLWNTDHGTGMIYKLDPSDGSVIDSFSAPGSSTMGLTWDGLYLWNADNFNNRIYQIDVGGENQPPDLPIITGPTNGRIWVEYEYNFSISDPDEDSMHIRLDWEHGTPGKWDGPFPSDSIIKYNYTWRKIGTYNIRAQTMDSNGLLSDWGELVVTMPRDKAIQNTMFQWFLERLPLLYWLFQRLGLQ